MSLGIITSAEAGMGDLGPTVAGVLIAEMVLGGVFVAARCYTRLYVRPIFGWDDALIVLAWVLFVPMVGILVKDVTIGFGKHYSVHPNLNWVEIAKLEVIAQTFGVYALPAGKASVAIMIARIFPGRKLHLFLWFVGITVTIFYTLLGIFSFVRCDPASALWNPAVDANCWTVIDVNFDYFVGAWATLADFILAILPGFLIYPLNMKKRDKYILTGVLGLGIFTGVCSLLKTIYAGALEHAGADYAYESIPLLLWTSTELTVTNVAASIPTLGPLLSFIRGHESAAGISFEKGDASGYGGPLEYATQREDVENVSGQATQPETSRVGDEMALEDFLRAGRTANT